MATPTCRAAPTSRRARHVLRRHDPVHTAGTGFCRPCVRPLGTRRHGQLGPSGDWKEPVMVTSPDRSAPGPRQQDRRPRAAGRVHAPARAPATAGRGHRRPGHRGQRSGRVREDADAGGLGAQRRGPGDGLDLAGRRRQRPATAVVGRADLAARTAVGRSRRRSRRSGSRSPRLPPTDADLLESLADMLDDPRSAGARRARRRARADRPGGAARPRPADPPPAGGRATRPRQSVRPADLRPPAQAGGPAARAARRRPAVHRRRHRRPAGGDRPAR